MLCYLSLKKKNYTKVNILILMYLQFIFYNYGHSFYNVSLYYQIINYLNSKSNICFIVVFFLLYELNKKKTNNIIISKIGFFFIWVGLSSTEINQFYLYYINNKNNINNNLLNGIMLIHPYVLYYFYIYFIYYHHHTISNFCLQKLFF